MPRTLENKKAIVADFQATLNETQLALVVDYKGLTVAEITDLRDRLYPTGSECKIVKNTLVRIAVSGNSTWEPIQNFLKGTNAFVLVKDDLGGAIKAYQDFQKATKKTELCGGVMEGRALGLDDLKAIVDLPSKEELMARIAGGINRIPTKLAVGLNAVPTQLAVGVQEVPGQLARVIAAVAQQKGEADDNSQAA